MTNTSEDGTKRSGRPGNGFKDLTGNRYGMLTVLYRAEDQIAPNGKHRTMWHCKCDCGDEKDVNAYSLQRGTTTSCGCKRRMADDLTGKRFGRLKVISRAPSHIKPSGGRATMWHCRCDCGVYKDIEGNSLKRGLTKSCGCIYNEDLTDQRFNYWTVIKRAPDQIQPSGNHVKMWHCKCICGVEKDVRSNHLKSGASISCGCYAKKMLSETKVIDLTGKRFGRLTVLGRGDDTYKKNGTRVVRWHCICDCGTEKDISASSLSSGSTVSCGCYHKERQHEVTDLSGQRFGRLVVLYRAKDHIIPSGQAKIFWHCICDCGKEKDIPAGNLTTGIAQSCGCLRQERIFEANFHNLSGRRFGKWTVSNRYRLISLPGRNFTLWKCKCDCGNEKYVYANSLVRGLSVSCGCYHRSKLELYVSQYFESLGWKINKDYKTQVRFPGLIGTGNGFLSYDFAVLNNKQITYLIECQGIQHYIPQPNFGGEEQYKKQKEHDKIKRSFAKKNKIPLIEIKYVNTLYEDVVEELRKYTLKNTQ